jgi:hypothetical protein
MTVSNVLEWQFYMRFALSICIGLCLALIAAFVRTAPAQQAHAGPMGVLITPPDEIKIPDPLRPALPEGAVARLLQPTRLAPEGEEMLVYETGSRFEPNSHIAAINGGKRVADFSLAKLFEKDDVGENDALFATAQIVTREKTNAFIAAFRNIGDGARTLFVIVAHRAGQYEVSWQKWSSKAQLKIMRNGRLQLWDASEDGQCVWCAQHYNVHTFDWRDGHLNERSHSTTRRILNPGPIADAPIVIEKFRKIAQVRSRPKLDDLGRLNAMIESGRINGLALVTRHRALERNNLGSVGCQSSGVRPRGLIEARNQSDPAALACCFHRCSFTPNTISHSISPAAPRRPKGAT